jgi:hypothetical protein
MVSDRKGATGRRKKKKPVDASLGLVWITKAFNLEWLLNL